MMMVFITKGQWHNVTAKKAYFLVEFCNIKTDYEKGNQNLEDKFYLYNICQEKGELSLPCLTRLGFDDCSEIFGC